MDSPKVSVIIPVYNIASYLPQCLDSLKAQTLAEIEVLCIDDTSADGSAQIVLQYAQQDPRFRLIQQEHLGVSAARNLGIAQSCGQYIAFIDGDDWAEPDMLEQLYTQAEQTASDVVICSSTVHFAHQDLRSLRRNRSLQAALTVSAQTWTADNASDLWALMDTPGVWPFIWNKLIRSDLIKENKVAFPYGLPLGEDGVFLHCLFQYAQKVTFLPKALHHYRYLRKTSATNRLAQDKLLRFSHHITVTASMLEEFSARGILAQNKAALLRWFLRFLYADMISLPAEHRQSTALTLRELFARYDLAEAAPALDPIRRRRLRILTSNKPCTNLRRTFDIYWTKVENRLLRFF